jgi:hypothetical protein
MFCKDLFKDWLFSHFIDCGWYLDYPKDYTPLSKIALHKKIEPRFQSGFQAPLTTLVEASKKKGRRKRKEQVKKT